MSQTRINGDTANNTLHFYYLDYFKLTFAVYQEADSEFLCSFSIRLDSTSPALLFDGITRQFLTKRP